MLVDKHKREGARFENEYPQIFSTLRESGVLTKQPNGIKEKFTNTVRDKTAKFGMSNRDVLIRSSVAIKVKESIKKLNGYGKSTDDVRKSYYQALSKVVAEELTQNNLPQDKLNNLNLTKNALKSITKYIGKPTNQRGLTP